jgi:hypothetical protein
MNSFGTTEGHTQKKYLRVTAVAQWPKMPGSHCYDAGSIPAVTPRYSTNKIRKALGSTKKELSQRMLKGLSSEI